MVFLIQSVIVRCSWSSGRVSNLDRAVSKKPWASCYLTYCVHGPTQPPPLSGTGDKYIAYELYTR